LAQHHPSDRVIHLVEQALACIGRFTLGCNRVEARLLERLRKLDLPHPSILWRLDSISLMKLTQRINLSLAGFCEMDKGNHLAEAIKRRPVNRARSVLALQPFRKDC
jgi:hypothetical protein